MASQLLCRTCSRVVRARVFQAHRPLTTVQGCQHQAPLQPPSHIPVSTVNLHPAQTCSSALMLLEHSLHPCLTTGQRNHQTRAHGTNSPSPANADKPKDEILTIPTMLTLARVAAIPVLVAAWYSPSAWATTACTAVFLAASITDWLDGYLARKMNSHSQFGAFLDPVADKLMVAAVLILLSTKPLAAGPLAGNDWLIPVLTLVTIGREITMSALREWAATLGPEARQAVAVNALGKWKTASQMTALTLLLVSRDGGEGVLVTLGASLGPLLLCVATWLTVHSLAVYFAGLWKHMSR